MTNETLRQQLALYVQQRESHIANANAANGAIQALSALIEMEEKALVGPPPAAPEASPDPA